MTLSLIALNVQFSLGWGFDGFNAHLKAGKYVAISFASWRPATPTRSAIGSVDDSILMDKDRRWR